MNDDKWRRDVRRDSERLRQAEHNRRSLLAHTVFLGSLSVMFVAPLLGGAYLGHWLDSRGAGYSVHWTMNFILLGLALGIANVYYFIRKYW
jgi:ATP synthase protein I